MVVQNKKPKIKAYQLLLLCLCGLILGSAIPLIASLGHTGTPQAVMVSMEIGGAAILSYVFSLYLIKK